MLHKPTSSFYYPNKRTTSKRSSWHSLLHSSITSSFIAQANPQHLFLENFNLSLPLRMRGKFHTQLTIQHRGWLNASCNPVSEHFFSPSHENEWGNVSLDWRTDWTLSHRGHKRKVWLHCVWVHVSGGATPAGIASCTPHKQMAFHLYVWVNVSSRLQAAWSASHILGTEMVCLSVHYTAAPCGVFLHTHMQPHIQFWGSAGLLPLQKTHFLRNMNGQIPWYTLCKVVHWQLSNK